MAAKKTGTKTKGGTTSKPRAKKAAKKRPAKRK